MRNVYYTVFRHCTGDWRFSTVQQGAAQEMDVFGLHYGRLWVESDSFLLIQRTAFSSTSQTCQLSLLSISTTLRLPQRIGRKQKRQSSNLSSLPRRIRSFAIHCKDRVNVIILYTGEKAASEKCETVTHCQWTN